MPAPRLGQHNREILAEVGVGEGDYADLLGRGVVVEGE
jgi:crotonobetainyl-CoA:carnitine CoA-transferase CaiB-like acyl-CoA transferase